MENLQDTLLEHHEVLGKVQDFSLLLFSPGKANSALLSSIKKCCHQAFVEKGYQLEYTEGIDPYDKIYTHLVLWNDTKQEIAGWQRFTKTSTIVNTYGVESLYSASLFQFGEQMHKRLQWGFELGRSFIQTEYRKTLAFAYIWSGILKYIFREGDIKYIYGLMSVSGHYPPIVKAYIAYFYNLYFGKTVNENVVPYCKYTIPQTDLHDIKKHITGQNYNEDFIQLNHQIKRYECVLPDSLKHCMSFCEPEGTTLLAIGVDRDFGDCLDILSLAELDKIKPFKRDKYLSLVKGN